MSERFATICADPAWSFGDKLPGASRGAEKNYNVMSVDDICNLVLPPLADDCRLFLWRVSSQVEEAYRVVRAWGFVPKSEVVWQKLTKTGKAHFGMGRHVRASHETAIIAVRGRPAQASKSIRSTFSTDEEDEILFASQTGRHSEKPEYFYREIVEKVSPGPYVELFARQQRSGWTCIGDQAPEPQKMAVAL